MFTSAAIGVYFLVACVASGMAFDGKMFGLAVSFGVVAVICLARLFLGYLDTGTKELRDFETNRKNYRG